MMKNMDKMNYLKNNKELLKEWNYEKNAYLDLSNLTVGSNKKVWWKCSKGHEWQATISHRALRNQGCPYCSGRIPIKGENDLLTTNPVLVKEWNYSKNSIQPYDVKSISHKLIWWRCEKGHEWQAKVYSRVQGTGCPYCSNKKVLSGFNDLATKFYDISLEWHPTKNVNLLPTQVLPGSDKLVWWKCPVCEFEWQAKINSRAIQGTGCPNCFKYWGTSFPEQAILYYLKKSYNNVLNRTLICNIEIDIFIPDENIGIEYDGFQWHKNSLLNDDKKDSICQENKIKLIRVRENGLKSTKSAINILRQNRSTNDLENVIKEIYLYLSKPSPIVNIKEDRNKIISQYIVDKNELSFKSKNQKLAKEWDYKKNSPLKPEMVAANCNEKVWWICSKCGFNWQSVVSSRNKGVGCPNCAKGNRQNTRIKNKIKNGESLAKKYPYLLKEWNYDKNKISPNNITYGYGKKVWWICSKGHEWQATVNSRTYMGSGCPVCDDKKVLKDVNDLATTNPELIKEWDYSKNKLLNPNNVTYGSSKKVWWVCSKCGYNWQATINHRTLRKQGCPQCYRNKIKKLKEKNDKTLKN